MQKGQTEVSRHRWEKLIWIVLHPLPLPQFVPFPYLPAILMLVRCISVHRGRGGCSFVKLVEWLGLVEGSSAPAALCRGGRVEHRTLPLGRGCCGGGPSSANSSPGALCRCADGHCVAGGDDDDGDTGVCRGGDGSDGDGSDEDDDGAPRGTTGASVSGLGRLAEWLGRGRL